MIKLFTVFSQVVTILHFFCVYYSLLLRFNRYNVFLQKRNIDCKENDKKGTLQKHLPQKDRKEIYLTEWRRLESSQVLSKKGRTQTGYKKDTKKNIAFDLRIKGSLKMKFKHSTYLVRELNIFSL